MIKLAPYFHTETGNRPIKTSEEPTETAKFSASTEIGIDIGNAEVELPKKMIGICC